MDPRLPPARSTAASAEALAEAALAGREAEATVPFAGGRARCGSRSPCGTRDGAVRGAVVVSSFLPAGDGRGGARGPGALHEVPQGGEPSSEPIKAVYLSLYLFPALLILFGAVWLSLYLARRITDARCAWWRRARSASPRASAACAWTSPSGDDEFTALIASFNRMSERLARSEEEVEHTRAGLTRKNQELEERRRLMETVLETVGTGVVVVDGEGTITAVNAAACRLLDVDAATRWAVASTRR